MSELLTTVALLFIIAGPFLLLADRFDLPTVPMLIVAGLVAGWFVDEELTLELAQYGIALLVFAFGIGIDLSEMRTVLTDSEVAAVGQILVLGTLGVALGVALGVPIEEAAFLGIAAAFSSTIVGTALLRTEIRRDLVRGRLAESIHLVQDLVAILVLLALGADTLAADPIAQQLGYGVALLIAAVLVNRHFFDVVGRLAGGSDELMIVGVISMLVVFVGAAEAVGVSIVVGAFAAGLAVRYDPVEYLGLFNGIQSLRDFFAAIFFVTIGALVTLPFVGEVVPFVEGIGIAESVEKLLLAGVLVGLTAVVKPAVTTAILLRKGYEARTATKTSLGIDQVSEFALIIAIEAFILTLLTQTVFDAIILAAAVTMITSSLSQRHDERIYRALSDRGLFAGASHDKIDEASDVPQDLADHVVIIGLGRQGRRLVRACESMDRPYVVVENDPIRRDDVASTCDGYVFGDAMEPYALSKANVGDATVVVSTVDAELVSRHLLSVETDADVILRADDEETALDLLEAGARYVSVPDLLAGEQLVEHIEALLGGRTTPAGLRAERVAALDEEPIVDD